jgi:hypothetical protein
MAQGEKFTPSDVKFITRLGWTGVEIPPETFLKVLRK